MDVIKIGDLEIEIDRKDIKNAHLGVYPPEGRIRVAAPLQMSNDAVRLLVISKITWVKKQIKTFEDQERETKREYLAGESHYFFGKRFLLDVIHTSDRPSILIKGSQIQLFIDGAASRDQRHTILDEWYRTELKVEATRFIEKWKSNLGLETIDWEIRKMKTQWGSCLPEQNKIILNSELAKQPYHALEYVIVHELLHLKVPEHNDKFFEILSSKLPNWESLKAELNFRLPYVEFEQLIIENDNGGLPTDFKL
jgi:predicted metal-dependent hydrolase